MINSVLKSIWRQMRKNPVFMMINGVGLTLGLMAFFFILQYVAFQRSYNLMYKAQNQTYRLLYGPLGLDLSFYNAPGIVPRVKEEVAGVELASRYMTGIGNGVLLVEDPNTTTPKSFREDRVSFVDHDFLSIFDREVIAGAPQLKAPFTMVLTESAAMQYFQRTDITGQTLRLINQFGEHPFQITGVIADFPVNTNIETKVLASMPTFETETYLGQNTWMDINTLTSNFVQSFFKLSEASIANQVADYWVQLAEATGFENEIQAALQPIASMHLGNKSNAEFPTFGDGQLVRFLMIMAILILAIAWINYINLSTAQSIKKAKVVAVRKTIGAKRSQLIQHQLVETLLITTFSIMLAFVGCALLQPSFNYLVDFPLGFSYFLNPTFILGTLVFLVLTSLVAGFYVAFILTGHDPSTTLKGSFLRSKSGIAVRKVLVTAQFSITIAFISGTVIMMKQINYLQTKDMGIASEGRLAILGPSDFSPETIAGREAFLEQLQNYPFIEEVSASGGMPGRGTNFSFNASKDKEKVGESTDNFDMIFIDEKYFDIYGIQLLIGDPPTATLVNTGWWDSKKIYINETAALQLGFENPEEAYQQFLYYKQGNQTEGFQIAGIVKDYNHWSLHSDMSAMVFGLAQNHVWFTLLLNGETSSEQLADLENLYGTHFPKSPFIYQFVDEVFFQFYEADQRLGQIISISAMIAIFISCLGLFGLVTHIIEQRTKEIGIRKVLGASLSQIASLVPREFIPLIVIAIFIAGPFAYYIMGKWLENFAYRIDLDLWVFALAGIAALLIALTTVSIQSIRAALANPVDAIRNE